jgi:hypothetical protein
LNQDEVGIWLMLDTETNWIETSWVSVANATKFSQETQCATLAKVSFVSGDNCPSKIGFNEN